MKKTTSLFIAFFLAFLLIFSLQAQAQVGQIFQTIIGDPNIEPSPVDDDNEGEVNDASGWNQDPPAGYFVSPFSCKITYHGSTYPGPDHKWEIDFNRLRCASDKGDPLYATGPGRAILIQPGRVVIRHDKGNIYSLYGHVQNIKVKENERVKTRQKIAEIGNVGTGSPHLHFGQWLGSWPNMIPVKFEGKKHPASRPGDTLIDANSCQGVGRMTCKIKY